MSVARDRRELVVGIGPCGIPNARLAAAVGRGGGTGVVDLGTGDTTRIPVGAAPRKIVVQPAPLTSDGGPRVSIANFAFAPETLTVGVGETVTWVNEDGAPHGLSYKDGAKGVDPLLPGARFGRTFDKPGIYDYSCSVHPYMSGRVVVR